MKFTKYYAAESGLLKFINQQYAIKGEKIRLYRGTVFYIQSPTGRKVFKLYPPACTDSAVQTTHIILYLNDCGYPVVQIIPTVSGELYVTVNMPEGNCVGVLFEYANGIDIGSLHRWRDNKQPLINPLTKQFSRQVGLMHRLMEHYEKPLIHRGREHFVDKLVWLMNRDNYNNAKARDIQEYGNEIWDILEKLPVGFYHADMHTGNTKYRNGQFTWMDFDMACNSYPVLDIGWLLIGAVDFGTVDEGAFARSLRVFDEVYLGYTIERTLTDGEIAAVFHCAAVVYCGCIISELTMGMVDEKTNPQRLDMQHEWLMRWREYCGKLK